MMKGGGLSREELSKKLGGAVQKALMFWGKWSERVLTKQN